METSKKQKVDRHEMPCQPADVRRRNFKEVALGYDEATALAEAGRCLQCKKPLCVSGCPVNVPIRDFIGALRNGDVNEAYRLLKTANALPAVCGRVCPQEKQCESKCIVGKKGKPVAIGRLERFVADNHKADSACEAQTGGNACAMPVQGKKVACLGAGPASLSCAGYCAQHGIKVDVYEALHEAGGVLVYGIPSFRLPKDVVKKEVDGLRDMGVDFHLDCVGLLVLAPIGARLSEAFAGLMIGLMNSPIGPVIIPVFCAIYPYIVITGMHFNLMAVAMAIGGKLGKNPLTHPAGFLFQYTQAAACLAVGIKAKNADRKALAYSCAFSDAVPGISEPGMYGITFKYKTPLYAAMIGSAVGGIVCVLMNVGSYAGGPPNIFTFPVFINPQTRSTADLTGMIIACAVGAAVTFVATLFLYKDEKADEIDAQG